MTEIETFFSAWAKADAVERKATLDTVLHPDVSYADPRTETALTGVDAISDYLGMFTQMAPGAEAIVLKSDMIQSTLRATVAFRMADGKVQHGQYFVEPASGKIERLVGFVGTGAVE